MMYGVKMTAYMPNGKPYYMGYTTMYKDKTDALRRLERALEHPHPDHVKYDLVETERFEEVSNHYVNYQY